MPVAKNGRNDDIPTIQIDSVESESSEKSLSK